MRRSQFEIANPLTTTSVGQPYVEPPPPWPTALLVAAGALLLLAVGVSWSSHRLLGRFLSELDEAALEQGRRALTETVEQQRTSVLAHATLLSDDTRVRTTVLTPQFDEATVRDVLEDLKQASGASLMAVIDTSGKVRAVAGAQSLRDVDLGSSPVVKAALEKPAGDVWTFPDQVVAVAVAPIRSGGQVMALFAYGTEVGGALLAGIQRTTGVAGAVMIRDRIVASSSNDPAVQRAFQTASAIEDGATQTIATDSSWVARAARTSESAVAGRAVFLVPRHHQSAGAGLLRIMSWAPIAVVGLALILLASSMRGRTID